MAMLGVLGSGAVVGGLYAAYSYLMGNSQEEEADKPDFVIHYKLGEGGFGRLYKASAKNGNEFAFKFITSPSILETKRETMPVKLGHENIICIHDAWNLKTRINSVISLPSDIEMPVVALQLELCDNMLRDELYKDNKASESKWKFATFKQILNGVEYLHLNDIVHRDLKPENILFKAGIVKITGFGLAKEGVFSQICDHTGGIESMAYWAPEQQKGDSSNKKADVFSLGIICAEIWAAGGGKIEREAFLNWASKLPLSFTSNQNVQHVEENIQNMIVNMTLVNPDDRFSIFQLQNQFRLVEQ